jgi:hypothetical protein
MKIKFLAAVLMLGITNYIQAGDNKVYIDQVGDRSTIAITQDGSSNLVKGVGTAQDTNAKIHGDDAAVTITQTGAANQLVLGVNGGALGSNNIVSYTVTGNLGNATIDCNNADTGKCNANNIGITQVGNNSLATVTVNGENNVVTGTTTGGNNNQLYFNITGDGLHPSIAITGGGNSGSITMAPTAGINATATMTITGSSNNVNINQTGGAVLGHTAQLGISGSGNTITVVQTGTAGDNLFNLTSSGSSNSITVNQNTQ